jgi:hypothetical protein
MTKIYDALQMAEAERAAGRGVPQSASAGFATHASGGSELEQLRAILIGNLPQLLEEAIGRLSAKIGEQSASLRTEFEELEQKLGRRITEIEARSNQGHSDLREQILSQSKLLTDSIQERGEHAIQVSVQGVKELREGKLDRGDFAEFLRNMAEHFARAAAGGGANSGESGAKRVTVG